MKVVILSDIHGTREDPRVVQHAIDNHGDAMVWIINGDFMECIEASPFPGAYPEHSMVEEHNYAVEWLEAFRKRIPTKAKIRVNLGNHEHRVNRGGQKFNTQASKLYGLPDVLSIVTQGIVMEHLELPAGGKAWQPVKKYDFDNVFYTPGLNSFACAVGTNCRVRHAAKGLKLSSSMSRLWLIDFSLPRWPNARLVIQGHTHRRADHPMGAYRYIESGCCCEPEGYEDAFGRSGWPPLRKGYVVLDYNPRTRLVDMDNVLTVDLGSATLFNPVPFIS
jgi:predicted phosphodiesterase